MQQHRKLGPACPTCRQEVIESISWWRFSKEDVFEAELRAFDKGVKSAQGQSDD